MRLGVSNQYCENEIVFCQAHNFAAMTDVKSNDLGVYNKQRFDLYSKQDEVDEHKEALIAGTKEKLRQNVRIDHNFTIMWRVK